MSMGLLKRGIRRGYRNHLLVVLPTITGCGRGDVGADKGPRVLTILCCFSCCRRRLGSNSWKRRVREH